MHCGAVTACGSRYYTPLKRRISSTTPAALIVRHLRPPCRISVVSPHSSCCAVRLFRTSFVGDISLFDAMKRYFSGSGITENKKMVEHLQHFGVISSVKVAEVMGTIDRGLFVPDGSPPYDDSPMLIGYNATISAPHMHAMCLELLEKKLQPGMRALDIGSGTGYLTACFAMMVGAEGRAIGVEHIPELAATSIENIQKSEAASLLKDGSLAIHVGDGRLGWPEFAPYDAIHVGAAAPAIPQCLIDQLKPGGRLVIPVGNIFQELQVVDKDLKGQIHCHSQTSVRYVPLTSRQHQLGIQ
uniref:Protein-L-isoaspartate O-methyltransferase n=1 Tax=Kalanchoe fedtschenkoi TaxID=63787 RepID=A0A7N0RAM2_KALFE